MIGRPRLLVDAARHGRAPRRLHEVIVQRTQELAASLRRSGSARGPAWPARSGGGWRSAARRTGSRCCPTCENPNARSRSAIWAAVTRSGRLPRKRSHCWVTQSLVSSCDAGVPAANPFTAASTLSKAVAVGWVALGGMPGASSHGRQVDPFLERGVVAEQVGAEVGDEVVGRRRGEGPAPEPGAQPGVEPGAPDDRLDQPQQRRALVVGDRGHAVVGIAAGERRAAGACPSSRRRGRRSRRSARGGRAPRASPCARGRRAPP